MKKRAVVAILLGIVAACAPALGGCKKKGEGIDPDKTQIYIGTYIGGYGTEFLDGLAAKFMAENPEIDAEYQIVNQPDKISDVLVQSAIAGGYAHQAYFWPNNNFMTSIYGDKLEDLSDVLAMKVDGTDRSIGQKLWNSDMYHTSYSKFGEGMYALPWAESTIGLIFDHDLFVSESIYEFAGESDLAAVDAQGIEAEPYNYAGGGSRLRFVSATGEVNYEAGDDILTPGQDGTYGTYDDGQPTTMAGFDAMIARIIGANMKPFISAGKETVTDYSRGVLDAIFAKFAGKNGYDSYFTYDSKGESVALQGGTSAVITDENGYLGVRQKALADAYAVYDKYFNTKNSTGGAWAHPAVSNPNIIHTDAQNLFLLGYRGSDDNQAAAFLTDGSWWEYEARNMFKNFEANNEPERGYGKREYRNFIWPDVDGQKWDKAAMGTYANGVIIVPKDKDAERLAVTKKFIAYCLSDEGINYFLKTTGSAMPYDVAYTADTMNALTPYQKNSLALYGDRDNVFVTYAGTLRFSHPVNYMTNYDIEPWFVPKKSKRVLSNPILAVRDYGNAGLADLQSDLLNRGATEDQWQAYLAQVKSLGFQPS